ncbi:MAG: hypothetical protein AAGC96_00095 [Pseudomonadota bacterium]
MNPPSINEVSGYLTGVFKMVQGDDAGLRNLDLSTDGFWRSFWALIYSIPAFCVIWAAERRLRLQADSTLELGTSAFARDFVVEILTIAVVLLVVAMLARPMGIADRFAHWVISTNWLTLPVIYVVASVHLAASSVAGGELFFLIASIATLVVYFRVYRVALAGDGMLAFMVLMIALCIEIFITIAAGS